MKYRLLFILLFPAFLFAQEVPQRVLTFEEYLAMVKSFHPVARQAGLQLGWGEAELLRARGAFDPKIEVDYDRKEFKGTEYYDILNSSFKVPTWYGLEIKANFEQNQGVYLNPQNYTPEEGLFSAGVSLDVGQGMFINDRMASIRSARFFREQTVADRDLMVNEVLYEASLAYFEWLRVFNEVEIYSGFLENAMERYEGVKRNAMLGEVAAIDTVEARIPVQNRMLELEQARIDLVKQGLVVSNFLWLENNVPVELQPEIIPDTEVLESVDDVLEIPEGLQFALDLEGHPKLRSLEFKLRALEVDRRLKANRLLPEINLEYNFITPDVETLQSFTTANYKAGLSFRFPLFLRKERGDLRIADFKVQDAEYDLQLNERTIENKIIGTLQELESYEIQIGLADEMTANYSSMLAAEERKMSFGESSLFLLNTREIGLIEARLKQNDTYIKYLRAKARLFQSLGTFPQFEGE